MNISHITQSKYFKNSAIIIGISLIALASFTLGVAVGIHKAQFSYAWGQNYERNFVGKKDRAMNDDQRGDGRNALSGENMMERFGFDAKNTMRDFRNGHGIAGTVISLSDTSLIIKDKFDKENTITVNDKTTIMRKGERITIHDVAENDALVVVGHPLEDGTISADFIRVFPSKI